MLPGAVAVLAGGGLRVAPRGDGSLGSTPIVDTNGQHCATTEAVDAAVRGFWVDSVLRRHAGVEEAARWQALLVSKFGGHIPVVV